MAEVNITINGRSFSIFCEDGQESRVSELGGYVDSRLKEVASAGAATNEAQLMVLTSLMLSDEIFDLRKDIDALGAQTGGGQSNENNDAEVAQAIDELANRIDRISGRIQSA